MSFWNILKSIWFYFFFSDKDLTLSTLHCPAIETIDQNPDNKKLSEYFNVIIAKKQDGDILHRFNDQDVFEKKNDPTTMIYTQAIPKENIEYDLQAMRTHKYLSKIQTKDHMMVTEFKEINCVMLEKKFYFFMNEETKCDGVMPRVYERDTQLFKDFHHLPFRLDFFNRILDKYDSIVKAGYKFDKILKGQILFRTLKVEAEPPRIYDPLFDIYYWTSQAKPKPTQDNPNPPTDRLDMLIITLLIIDLEFDYMFTVNKNNADPKYMFISEQVLQEAEFPESVTQIDDQTKKSIPKLIMFISSVFDMTVSLQDSRKDVDIARELISFLKRVLIVLNKNNGMTGSELETYSMFFGGLVTACLNDQNILKTPDLEPIIDINIEILENLVEHEDPKKVKESLV